MAEGISHQYLCITATLSKLWTPQARVCMLSRNISNDTPTLSQRTSSSLQMVTTLVKTKSKFSRKKRNRKIQSSFLKNPRWENSWQIWQLVVWSFLYLQCSSLSHSSWITSIKTMTARSTLASTCFKALRLVLSSSTRCLLQWSRTKLNYRHR